jgi:hypothetical protein
MLTWIDLLDFERVLLELGAVKHNDARLSKADDNMDNAPTKGSLRGPKVHADEDDSDWD